MDMLLTINSVVLALTGMGLLTILHNFYKAIRKYQQNKENRFLQLENDTNLLKMNMLSLLRDRLYNNCKKAIECGYVTVYELENINSMYNEYRSLNGNSFITELYEKVTQLKIVTGGI